MTSHLGKALWIVGIFSSGFLAPHASAHRRSPLGKALVYRGPGSCEEHCSEAAALTAESAGFVAVFVGPDEVRKEVFEDAKVWIQPGGMSSTVAQTMLPDLKANLKRFVAEGGAYVGYCAGGFLATPMIASRGIEGLGLLPGLNGMYVEPNEAMLYDIQWNGKTRKMYWEGGPYFILGPNDTAEVTATYPNGQAASVRAPYGLGRVYVTGLHPEAPQDWRDYFKMQDTDGLDVDLAVEMIRWATHTENPSSSVAADSSLSGAVAF